MRLTGTDRRHVAAVRELMAAEIEAEIMETGIACVYILRPEAIDCIEARLDELLPAWRADPCLHRSVSKPAAGHLLMRVRELACRGYGVSVYPMSPELRREQIMIATKRKEAG